MYQSILKMMVLCLVLLGNLCSFGMIVRYKDEDHKKRVRANCQRTVSKMKSKGVVEVVEPEAVNVFDNIETKLHIINCLDNPITFGQTNKENHSLVKYEGLRNLRLAYQKKDPNFVLNHYVPILPVCRHINKMQYRFDIITPYDKTFYCLKNDDNELDENICSLGKKRLQQFIDQKRIKYGYHVYRGGNGSDPEVLNNPLILVALFGSKEDVEKELQKKEGVASFWGGGNTLIDTIRALVSNPDIDNNNALEILFKDPRTLYVGNRNETEYRGKQYYNLLDYARQTNNKKAFKIFVTEDIHNSKNVRWVNTYGRSRENFPPAKTAFDLVIEHNERFPTADHLEGPFSEQDVALLKEHGAKTALANDINTTQDHHNQRRENRAICTIF